MKDEEQVSGTNPQPTEPQGKLLKMNKMLTVLKAKRKKKQISINAENMRWMALEKLGETQKRAAEESEDDIGKKRRRSGNEAIEFPQENRESKKAFREVELVLKCKQQEREKKKFTAFLGQQKSMMQLMQAQKQQQVQNNNIQMVMMVFHDKISNNMIESSILFFNNISFFCLKVVLYR